MWIIWKKVGLFDHYFDFTGKFQPKIENAKRFPSKEMADIVAKAQGGIVRPLPKP